MLKGILTNSLISFCLFCTNVYAGGGDFPGEQVSKVPQQTVVVVPQDEGSLVAVIVAVIGALGVIGAAYFSSKRKG